MTAIEPGDRVRVISGPHRTSMEGNCGEVVAVHDTWAEVRPDGCSFTTIDPDLAHLLPVSADDQERGAAILRTIAEGRR